METHSGGRTVSVVWLGALIESCPDGPERFQFGSDQRIVCPACGCSIDPSKSYRSGTPRLRRIA
jgi:hypothetical protein